MSDKRVVEDVRCLNVRVALPTPIHFGTWEMTQREFAVIRVDDSAGGSGAAYCITRDGPVAEIVAELLRKSYVGLPVATPADNYYAALHSFPGVVAAGIGMRALSVVDIAMWDLHARSLGKSIVALVGKGTPAVSQLPATAIVGYPPSIEPEAAASQAQDLLGQGWRRFKLPCAPTLEATVERLRAVRDVAPHAWLGLDMNMTMRTIPDVVRLDAMVRGLRLGWIEDLYSPGDAEQLAETRRMIETPIAVGDEQGGAYHPQALLSRRAVDVLRVDATTNGGITRFGHNLGAAHAAHTPVAPHMFPHVHARLLAAFGVRAPVEWGVPGTGVHPMDDALEQPTITDGDMQPLSEEPGLGRLINPIWIAGQETDDPSGLLNDLPADLCVAAPRA